ncbi:MAG: hypothetical protein LBV41_10625 [Cytophagaceae bacterium]|jgi:hypothetical protein|nr:hypothetical protein [Cytophagaceae bacterium]
MKNSINKFIRRFGYEIRSVKVPLIYTQEQSSTKGLTVEFVGAPGIGKTTFFNKIYPPPCEKMWFTRNDLYKAHPYGINIDALKYIDNRLSSAYSCMLSHLYNRMLKMDFQLHRVVEFYSFHIQIARYDALIRYGNFSRGFLLDEGFLKNFAEEIVFIYSLAEEGNPLVKTDELKQLWENRVIVYISAGEDYVVNNLKKRALKSEDVISNWYSFYGEERTKLFVRKEVSNAEKLFSIAKENKVKTLCLNIENEEEKQMVEKFSCFINSLIDNKKSAFSECL